MTICVGHLAKSRLSLIFFIYEKDILIDEEWNIKCHSV